MSDAKHDDLQVAVITTSGRYPTAPGTFDPIPEHQKVKIELAAALRELRITGATDWVATVNARPIDPEKSYIENDLRGSVTIDYGPRESGGGDA